MLYRTALMNPSLYLSQTPSVSGTFSALCNSNLPLDLGVMSSSGTGCFLIKKFAKQFFSFFLKQNNIIFTINVAYSQIVKFLLWIYLLICLFLQCFLIYPSSTSWDFSEVMASGMTIQCQQFSALFWIAMASPFEHCHYLCWYL